MSGRWGIMVHWIPPGPAPQFGDRITNLSKAVERFDLDRFISNVRDSGASWVIFTLGQNTGLYLGNNSYLTKLGANDLQSSRDLTGEIASALVKNGRHLIAYLPAEVGGSRRVQELFDWNKPDKGAFETAYLPLVRAYSDHLGKNCAGWFYDGCYDSRNYPHAARAWQAWAAAARSGNPDAVVSFNDGSFLSKKFAPLSPEQDFLSGEFERIIDEGASVGRNSNDSFRPSTSMVPNSNCLYHALTPIDCSGKWSHDSPGNMPPPRYTDNELFSFVSYWTRIGAAVSLNVGIYQEGYLGDETLAQLARLKDAVRP